jgi:AcrR family transcriptional regulator
MYPDTEVYPKSQRLTRAESRARTRQDLLDAAARVFIQRGFQGASIEAIAAEAGYTRGAFYSNFESKVQLFVELLQQRVYQNYRDLIARMPARLSPESLRWTVRELVESYSRGDNAWLFALWLECLAHVARHREFASLAATFWRGTRTMIATQWEEAYRAQGRELPIEARHIAIGLTALDIGLAVQNLVDPEEAPLDLYPELYELLFVPLLEPVEPTGAPAARPKTRK